MPATVVFRLNHSMGFLPQVPHPQPSTEGPPGPWGDPGPAKTLCLRSFPPPSGEGCCPRATRKPAYCSHNASYSISSRQFSGISPMKAASRKRAPTTVKRTVRRGRRPNGHYRTREYLTEKEVERLMKAAGRNRYGHRDATMILLAFRHGLRASELCSLRWEQVDLTHARLHVSRL